MKLTSNVGALVPSHSLSISLCSRLGALANVRLKSSPPVAYKPPEKHYGKSIPARQSKLVQRPMPIASFTERIHYIRIITSIQVVHFTNRQADREEEDP
jgi:hypothetical protein